MAESGHVMVVDDSASNRLVVEGHLEAAGYRVTSFASGQVALEAASSDPPDLMLLDILDGFEVCRRLRASAIGARMPIVFVTALDERDVFQRARDVGADDLLSKPVRFNELLLRVSSLMRLRVLQSEIETRNQALRATAELRAEQNERRFQTLFEASSDAILVHDSEGRVVESNSRGLGWLQRERGDLLGRAVGTLVSADSASACAEALDAILGDRRVVFEVEFVRNDGTSFPAEVSATRFELDGETAGQWFIRDITARRDAEARLATTRSNELAVSRLLHALGAAQDAFISGQPLASVFETLLGTVIALTESRTGFIGEIVDLGDVPHVLLHAVAGVETSPGLCALIADYEENDEIYIPVVDSMFGTMVSSGVPAIDNGATQGGSSFESLPLGHPPVTSFLGLPIQKGEAMLGFAGFGDRPGGYDVAVVDLLSSFSSTCASLIEARRTDARRRDSERALATTETRLRQAQKLEALGVLAGGVAHDFNNLLTSILAFSQFIDEALPEAHVSKSDVAEVMRAVRSGSQLTSQLLSFARRRPVEPRVVDVREIVATAQKMLRRIVGARVEFVVLTGDDPMPVLIDPGALGQVIFNLCVNARDAMPDGGTLTLRVGERRLSGPRADVESGRCIALTVRDTGRGMPPETIQRVFEPFFTTKGEKGTGLGLATCYGIAKQADGEIRVESKVGEGSLFTVLLPRVDAVPSEFERTETADRLIVGSGLALLVEDQPTILGIVARAFRKAGFRVLSASSAEEALALVRETEEVPDILVSDVVLPGQSGVWLMHRLRDELPGLPTVLTSGYMGDEGPRLKTDETTAFLPKPFTARQVLEKTAGMLGTVSGPDRDDTEEEPL